MKTENVTSIYSQLITLNKMEKLNIWLRQLSAHKIYFKFTIMRQAIN